MEKKDSVTIAILIHETDSIRTALRWAGGLVKSINGQLLVIRYGDEPSDLADDSSAGARFRAALSVIHELGFERSETNDESTSDASSEKQGEALRYSVAKISSAADGREITDELSKRRVKLALLPRPSGVHWNDSAWAVERRIIRSSPCTILQIRIPDGSAYSAGSVLLSASGTNREDVVMRIAAEWTRCASGEMTVTYLQPDIDPTSMEVGYSEAERLVERLDESMKKQTRKDVIITRRTGDTAQKLLQSNADLIVMKTEVLGHSKRRDSRDLSERLLKATNGPVVGVFSDPCPIRNRVLAWGEILIRYAVPQLTRQRRVDLVGRIQSSSEWDFDFVALMCLSTLIAGLGLALNSGAVVIGAMLIAPLMTPIMGIGLSVVQGNRRLARRTAATVAKGFLVAYFIAIVLGLAFGGLELTDEMRARGSPGLPDLVVALVSGIAAAYAIGRPNLLSALPGVAIAAALVPPIATFGMATVLGEWRVAFGSGLLFFTNIVAIVLGSAISWWVSGFRDAHEHGGFGTWAPRIAIALAVVATAIGVHASEPWTRPLTELRGDIEELLDDDSDTLLLELSTDGRGDKFHVDIVLGASSEPSAELRQQLIDSIHRWRTSQPTTRIEWRKVWVDVDQPIEGSSRGSE